MADVFLSYARPDATTANHIANALRQQGFSVWYDEQLPAHRAYSEVIEEQLEAAQAVIVLWSSGSARSQWVRSEANRARETGRLVQVRLDDVRLPMPYDQIQCADLRHWAGGLDEPSWRSVAASVAALAGDAPESVTSPRQTDHSPSAGIGRRRAILAGGALALATVAGITAWRRPNEPRLSPEAQLLLQKGLDALQNNDALDPQDPGSTVQALALLTEATEAAPRSAVAWGGLALAYAARKQVAPVAERPGLDARSRSAARTALELDPKEIRALGALRLLEPVYRNWLTAERDDRRALKTNPRLPILLFIMSNMLGSVGRWREAAEFSKRFDRKNFLIPGADRKVIMDLWASGDLQGADRTLTEAIERWPQHPQIWRMRMTYLMYSGRPVEALALVQEGIDRPVELSSQFVDAVRNTAEALAGRRDKAEAVQHALDYVKANPKSALQVAQASAALGAPEEAFALLDGYYFGEGKWSGLAPPGGDLDRVTAPLFEPPMRTLWKARQFDRLLERIGLNDYWRRAGVIPDFRRRS